MILVIDSNEDDRELISQVLLKQGYDVNSVSKGQDALAIFKTEQDLQLVLIDLDLKEFDGFQILSAFRDLNNSQRRNIPVIAFSTKTLRSFIDKWLKFGVDQYLNKPIPVETFLSTIWKHLQTEQAKALQEQV